MPPTAKPKVASVAPAAPAKKKGLREGQTRIVLFLSKQSGPASRNAISEGAEVDKASLTEAIGASDPDKRKANDEKYYLSLISLGLVKEVKVKDAKGGMYELTAKGKQTAAKLG